MVRCTFLLALILPLFSFGAESNPLTVADALVRLDKLLARENPADAKRPNSLVVHSTSPDPREVTLTFGRFSRLANGTAELNVLRKEFTATRHEGQYKLTLDTDGFPSIHYSLLPVRLIADKNGNAEMILFPDRDDKESYNVFAKGDTGVVWKIASARPVSVEGEALPVLELGSIVIEFGANGLVDYGLETKTYLLSEALATKLEQRKDGVPVLIDNKKAYNEIPRNEIEPLIASGELKLFKDWAGSKFVEKP